MGCTSSAVVNKASPSTGNNNRARLQQPQQIVGNYKATVHDDFVRMTANEFYGRDSVIEQILKNHITTTANAPPLLLFGESGSGKSYVLAGLARRCMAMAAQNQLPKTTPGRPWRVFFHFCGSVPGSTDLLAMLRRLLFELQIIKTEWDLPLKLEDAIGLVCSALSKPSLESYIVIIDAINQIDQINNKDAPISWLPLNPAPNVRLVVSTRSDSDQYRILHDLYASWTFSPLLPMDIAAKRVMVKNQIASSPKLKSLQERELDLLTSTPGSDNPLWLLLATEEICMSSAEEPDELNKFITNLPKTLEGLEIMALERIERGLLGRTCVSSLCLLECSVNGLDLEEIYELLVAPTQLPIDLANLLAKKGGLRAEPEMTMEATLTQKTVIEHETWQKIEDILGFYVRMFVINAKNRLDFFHSSFARTVRQRYMLSTVKGDTTFRNKIISSWFHSRLANYFRSQNPNIKRRCECFPIHAHRCSDINGLISFLSDWNNFDTMYDKEFSRSLNKAWTFVYDLKTKAEKLKNRHKSQQDDQKIDITNAEIFKPMQDAYLQQLEKTYPSSADESFGRANKADIDKFVDRLERVAQMLSQNGCFEAALTVVERLVAFTGCYIGTPGDKIVPLRKASALYLKAQILDRWVKSVDYMNTSQLPQLELAVSCYKGAVDIFRQFAPIDDRIGKSLNRLGYVYSGINLRDGTESLNATDAKQAGIKCIEEALAFYMPMKDQQANLADCHITRGVCEGRANDAQIDFYTRALNVVIEEFGYFHPLLDRIYLNMGIYFEESGDLEKAYDCFRKWYDLAMLIFGPTHPMALRTIRTLNEENYVNIATQRGDVVPTVPEEIQEEVGSDDDED